MAYVNLVRGLGAARSRSRVLPGLDLYPRRSWRRGVAGFGSRGLGLSFPQVMVAVPQPLGVTEMPTAETSLANAAAQLANDPTSTAIDLPDLAAITANLISFAQTLCQASWAPYTCAGGFDPVAMGQKYANLVWAALQSNISPVSGQRNYNPLPGAVAPPSTAILPGAFDPAAVSGSSALPALPAGSSYYSSSQPSGVFVPKTPTAYAQGSAAGASASSSTPTPAGLVSGDGSNSAAAVPNWPLIGGAAALALGAMYLLGGRN
jgi:hypothetical protein